MHNWRWRNVSRFENLELHIFHPFLQDISPRTNTPCLPQCASQSTKSMTLPHILGDVTNLLNCVKIFLSIHLRFLQFKLQTFKMAGKFEPKTPVTLNPPKYDPISVEELAKCNGTPPSSLSEDEELTHGKVLIVINVMSQLR